MDGWKSPKQDGETMRTRFGWEGNEFHSWYGELTKPTRHWGWNVQTVFLIPEDLLSLSKTLSDLYNYLDFCLISESCNLTHTVIAVMALAFLAVLTFWDLIQVKLLQSPKVSDSVLCSLLFLLSSSLLQHYPLVSHTELFYSLNILSHDSSEFHTFAPINCPFAQKMTSPKLLQSYSSFFPDHPKCCLF